MHVPAATVQAAIRNGSDDIARRNAEAGERYTHVESVVCLLTARTSPAAVRGAGALLRIMAARKWDVIRGVHTSADTTPHVRLDIGNVAYHLRIDAKTCVFDITYKLGDDYVQLDGREPWRGPGV